MLSAIDAVNLQADVRAFRNMKAELDKMVLEIGLVLDRIEYFSTSAVADTAYDTDDLPL